MVGLLTECESAQGVFIFVIHAFIHSLNNCFLMSPPSAVWKVPAPATAFSSLRLTNWIPSGYILFPRTPQILTVVTTNLYVCPKQQTGWCSTPSSKFQHSTSVCCLANLMWLQGPSSPALFIAHHFSLLHPFQRPLPRPHSSLQESPWAHGVPETLVLSRKLST